MIAQPDTVLSKSARRYSLAVLVVVYTFNFIDRQILAILLPAIKAEFLVDDWVLGFPRRHVVCNLLCNAWHADLLACRPLEST